MRQSNREADERFDREMKKSREAEKWRSQVIDERILELQERNKEILEGLEKLEVQGNKVHNKIQDVNKGYGELTKKFGSYAESLVRSSSPKILLTASRLYPASCNEAV